jgi:glycerol-1-phosphatase
VSAPRTGGEAPPISPTSAPPAEAGPAEAGPAEAGPAQRNLPGDSTARWAAGTGLRVPGGSEVPLTERYDVALLDLDGVVYLGTEGVPGAAEALDRARAAGMRLAFVTNNASRTPEAVAAQLRRLGVHASAEEVVTSAQAACHVLAELLPPGARVLVVGGEGLRAEAAGRGFTLVPSADDGPAAVVQGYSPDIGWPELAEASVAIRHGALWVACNLDLTLPSPRGPLPGNGALVGAVSLATGVEPLSTGKPDPAMHRVSLERSQARRPLVVGDRLDTDVEGASRVGCDSMLVLTGVTTAAGVLDAGPARRPTYLAAGLDGLLTAHPRPRLGPDGGWTCGGWRVTAVRAQHAGRHGHVLAGAGDPVDALRALCAATWSAGTGAGAAPARPAGPAAEAALARLGLHTDAAADTDAAPV